jgi:GR25 family glycosyltransferase involved in LPS biosynthesis
MKGVYINLDCRTDRREHFEDLKKQHPFFSGIERTTAIENIEDRALGCCMSHIKALELMSSTINPYVAILEDDFFIFDANNFSKFVPKFQNIQGLDDWDVIVLTPRGSTIEGDEEMGLAGFKKIIDHQTATGYIVKTNFIPKLLENLNEACRLQQSGVEKNISANDQYWKKLQLTSNFYYFADVFGGQLPSWSNIENHWVDYNERFRNQHLF